MNHSVTVGRIFNLHTETFQVHNIKVYEAQFVLYPVKPFSKPPNHQTTQPLNHPTTIPQSPNHPSARPPFPPNTQPEESFRWWLDMVDTSAGGNTASENIHWPLSIGYCPLSIAASRNVSLSVDFILRLKYAFLSSHIWRLTSQRLGGWLHTFCVADKICAVSGLNLVQSVARCLRKKTYFSSQGTFLALKSA